MIETVAPADLVGSSEEPFVIADRGCVRFLILNRPQARNALTRQMRKDFPALLAAADADPAIAAIVLTGVDPAFCAGVDLKERGLGAPPPPVRPDPAVTLRRMRKPVIAAVNGACATGALEMALSCSFIIASDKARFADTHAKIGIFPMWGQSALLPRAIGIRRARQMMLTGAFIDADTACQWGIANEVVAHDGLLGRCLEIGGAIGAADPFSVGLHMDVLGETEARFFDPAFQIEERTVAIWEKGVLERQGGDK